MRKRLFTCLAATLLATATSAVAAQPVTSLSAESGLVAIGTAQSFEVLTLPGMGKADYFCAAGTFAWIRLNASNTDRLVVSHGRAPSEYRPNRLAIGFRLAGPEVRPRGNILLGPSRGQTKSVGHARALCTVGGRTGF